MKQYFLLSLNRFYMRQAGPEMSGGKGDADAGRRSQSRRGLVG